MDYKEIFDKLNPGFFDREYIKDMKEHWIFAELVMDLKKKLPVTDPVSCPEGIAFRYFDILFIHGMAIFYGIQLVLYLHQ